MKCIFCGSVKFMGLQSKSLCVCRRQKIAFDKVCNKYKHISDCVPAQPIVHSFKKNLQAVTAYIEQNNIPDMKVSELINQLG